MAWEEKHGRPSEYKEEYVDAVNDYLAYAKQEDELPSKQGFAEYIDVSIQTLENWSEKSQDFLEALRRITVKQHNELVNKGLNNKYNPTITKLMLSSNHGYKEKSDMTSGDKPLAITFDSSFAE